MQFYPSREEAENEIMFILGISCIRHNTGRCQRFESTVLPSLIRHRQNPLESAFILELSPVGYTCFCDLSPVESECIPLRLLPCCADDVGATFACALPMLTVCWNTSLLCFYIPKWGSLLAVTFGT